MHGTPGSYASKPINDALGTLPIGQISGVIEGARQLPHPQSRKPTPRRTASFEEVQDKIKPMLEAKKMHEENDAFLRKLKQNALIETFLEKNDPKKP